MVLPSKPPMTAPPTVPAMQLNSELRELLEPEGVWQAASAPALIKRIASVALFMVLVLGLMIECRDDDFWNRSEEHTSELQSLMRISYAVFCLKKKNNRTLSRIDMYIYKNQMN